MAALVAVTAIWFSRSKEQPSPGEGAASATASATEVSPERLFAAAELARKVPQGLVAAFVPYLKAAEAGSPPAMTIVADCFRRGIATGRDKEKAAEWERKAFAAFLHWAENDDAAAQREITIRYREGKGTPKDAALADKWAKRAFDSNLKLAEKGDRQAQLDLGRLYFDGEGTAKDMAKAVEWWHKSAAQGLDHAQGILGLSYEEGNGVQKDAVKAVEWYRKVAEKGHPVAQWNMGVMYAAGNGVPLDLALACDWYAKSANQGYDEAQVVLGELYAAGRGVPQDLAKAVEWKSYAACQGNAEGQFQLGEAYMKGDGMGARAAGCYSCAASQGHASAQRRLSAMYEQGDGVARDPVLAYKWRIIAAASVEVEADREWLAKMDTQLQKDVVIGVFRNVADAYENGDEVPRDEVKAAGCQSFVGKAYWEAAGIERNLPLAIQWLEKAWAHRTIKASHAFTAGMILAQIYAKGDGVPRDVPRAKALYREASQSAAVTEKRQAAFVLASTLAREAAAGSSDEGEVAAFFKDAVEAKPVPDVGSDVELFCELLLPHSEDVDSAPIKARWCLVLAKTVPALLAVPDTSLLYLTDKAADQPTPLPELSTEQLFDAAQKCLRSKDYQGTIRFWSLLAKQGNPYAQNNLGTMFMNGEGVRKDAVKAAEWYRMAAEQGLADAQADLGFLYSEGRGVPKNATKAAEWMRKAAEQGHNIAQRNLGVCYSNGDGVPRNFVLAYKWWALSAAGGNGDAKKLLAQFERGMTASQIAEAQRLAAEFVPQRSAGKSGSLSIAQQEGMRPGGEPMPMMPPRTAQQREAEGRTGTGFFITPDGYFLTARHVITGAKKIQIRTVDGKMRLARVVQEDKKLDLILLKVEAQNQTALPLVSNADVTLGLPVLTVGFPNPEQQGLEPKYTDGKISALTGIQDDPDTMQVSVPIQPGNSGGALTDTAGRVIGVVTHRLDAVKMLETTGNLSENVNYAIKSNRILAFLKGTPAEHGLARATPHIVHPPDIVAPETIQRVKQATALVVASP